MGPVRRARSSRRGGILDRLLLFLALGIVALLLAQFRGPRFGEAELARLRGLVIDGQPTLLVFTAPT